MIWIETGEQEASVCSVHEFAALEYQIIHRHPAFVVSELVLNRLGPYQDAADLTGVPCFVAIGTPLFRYRRQNGELPFPTQEEERERKRWRQRERGMIMTKARISFLSYDGRWIEGTGAMSLVQRCLQSFSFLTSPTARCSPGWSMWETLGPCNISISTSVANGLMVQCLCQIGL